MANNIRQLDLGKQPPEKLHQNIRLQVCIKAVTAKLSFLNFRRLCFNITASMQRGAHIGGNVKRLQTFDKRMLHLVGCLSG